MLFAGMSRNAAYAFAISSDAGSLGFTTSSIFSPPPPACASFVPAKMQTTTIKRQIKSSDSVVR